MEGGDFEGGFDATDSLVLRLRRRPLRGILFGLFGIALVGAAVVVLYVAFIYANAANAGTGERVRVEVPRGATVGQVAALLDQAHVIDRPLFFELYAQLRRAGPSLQAGNHLLANDLSPKALIEELERPGVEPVTVRIPDGATMLEISTLLESAHVTHGPPFQQAVRNPALLRELGIPFESAEGYLYPDTYTLWPGSSADTALRELVGHFRRAFDAAAARHPGAMQELATRAHFAERDVVLLASVVEKAARRPADRPMLAAVLINRLAPPPAPVVPGAPRTALPAATPFPALPTAPVCNPGAASIEAVLVPASTTGTAYAARPDGALVFGAAPPPVAVAAAPGAPAKQMPAHAAHGHAGHHRRH